VITSDTPETDAFFAEWTRTDGVLARSRLHAEKLERERDEAIRQLENLKAVSIHTCHDQCQRPMCVLRRERDEAREKIKRQAERICQLEGATNHAGGTPLSIALRERDEAREKLDEEMKWHHRTHTELVQTQCKILDMQMGRDEIQEKYDKLATEHMLVVNKICGERDEAREEHRKLKIILDIIKKETL
jgi:hypothetical protein